MQRNFFLYLIFNLYCTLSSAMGPIIENYEPPKTRMDECLSSCNYREHIEINQEEDSPQLAVKRLIEKSPTILDALRVTEPFQPELHKDIGSKVLIDFDYPAIRSYLRNHIKNIRNPDVNWVRTLCYWMDSDFLSHTQALPLAVVKDEYAIAELLLELGADPNQKEPNTDVVLLEFVLTREMLIHYSEKDHKFVKLLIKHKADTQLKPSCAANFEALAKETKNQKIINLFTKE